MVGGGAFTITTLLLPRFRLQLITKSPDLLVCVLPLCSSMFLHHHHCHAFFKSVILLSQYLFSPSFLHSFHIFPPPSLNSTPSSTCSLMGGRTFSLFPHFVPVPPSSSPSLFFLSVSPSLSLTRTFVFFSLFPPTFSPDLLLLLQHFHTSGLRENHSLF